MNDLKTLCYISEQTSYPEDHRGSFGYKFHPSKTGDKSRFFVTFDSPLHSFGVLNRNKRMYLEKNIMDKICTDPYITEQLRNNSWGGELDHPSAIIDGQDLSANRIGNPDPSHTSHFIRRPCCRGNILWGSIQTDSGTEEGRNLASKIVDGKLIPAFSARSMGELVNMNGNPVVMVKRLITYDEVFYPSHIEARATGVNEENYVCEAVESFENYAGGKVIFFTDLAKMAANNSKETEWLCESFDLTIDSIVGLTEDSSIVISENKNIYVQPISDKNIRKKVSKELKDWLN